MVMFEKVRILIYDTNSLFSSLVEKLLFENKYFNLIKEKDIYRIVEYSVSSIPEVIIVANKTTTEDIQILNLLNDHECTLPVIIFIQEEEKHSLELRTIYNNLYIILDEINSDTLLKTLEVIINKQKTWVERQ